MPGLDLSSAHICSDPQCLDDLAPAWNALLHAAVDDRLFLTPLWQRIWWRHFAADQTLQVVTVGNGELDALLPLCLDGETLRFVGGTELSDYLDGVARAEDTERAKAIRPYEEAWRTVFERLQWTTLDLVRIPAGSPTLTIVPAVARESFRTLSCHIDAYLPCPVVSVPASWEAFLLQLSKKNRHELRRKLRRALADDDWTWRASQTREELRDDLQTFFRLHRSSRTDKAAFLTPAVEAFFRDIVHALFEQSQVRLGIFARDGQPLAATLSFVYRGRYMLYNSGHDPAARALSPGIVATALAIQDAIALGCEVFDFLSGPERYKYHFGAHDEWTYRIVVERAAA